MGRLMRLIRQKFILIVLLTGGLPWLTGCGTIINSAVDNMAGNMAAAITDNNDLATVKEGGPAFLLLMDGMIRSNPDNVPMLITGATVYSAYSGVFFPEGARAEKLTDKALDYGLHAMCATSKKACDLETMPYASFIALINTMKKKDVPTLFALGSAWAGWIAARSEDWDAVALIPRVEAIMNKVAELDETHQNGSVHIYLGVLETLAPAALGGHPEKGYTHFTRALELSDGANLMAKVMIARKYARMKLDRELHDRMCREVLKADAGIGDMTLVNTMAKEKAQKLLNSADDWFIE